MNWEMHMSLTSSFHKTPYDACGVKPLRKTRLNQTLRDRGCKGTALKREAAKLALVNPPMAELDSFKMLQKLLTEQMGQ
jgi:hypothetical protein